MFFVDSLSDVFAVPRLTFVLDDVAEALGSEA